MQQPDKNIIIHVVCGDETYELRTFTGEYRNLMMLLYDKIYIPEFGDCRGMGRCGTCVIEIIESAMPLLSFDRNEAATLGKNGHSKADIRLACQILVDEKIADARIRVVEPG